MSKAIATPVQLYRYLLKTVKRLPRDQQYYKNYVRQGYNSHACENDPERIQQIIAWAVEDSEWVLKKYKVSS